MANERLICFKPNICAKTNGKQQPQMNAEGNRVKPVIAADWPSFNALAISAPG